MFSIFRKKTTAITEDRFHGFMESLKLHLNSIKLFHHNVEQKINTIDEKHNELDFKHANNVEMIKQWLEYFNKKHFETDKKLQILASYTIQLNETMEKNRTIDEEFIKKIIDDYVEIPKIDKDNLKKEIMSELNYTRTKVIDSPKENIIKKTDEITQDILTNSEKWLLNIMFNFNEPVTYEQISGRTGKSLNTIRVYMNSLKNKGSLVEETILPNGIKVFAITNKEKAKRLYNINTM